MFEISNEDLTIRANEHSSAVRFVSLSRPLTEVLANHVAKLVLYRNVVAFFTVSVAKNRVYGKVSSHVEKFVIKHSFWFNFFNKMVDLFFVSFNRSCSKLVLRLLCLLKDIPEVLNRRQLAYFVGFDTFKHFFCFNWIHYWTLVNLKLLGIRINHWKDNKIFF